VVASVTAVDQLRGSEDTPDARVLVAVDVSASMGCPVELEVDRQPPERCTAALRATEDAAPVDDQRLTRIQAAGTWAASGVRELTHDGDTVGLSTFSTSRGAGSRRVKLRRKARPDLRTLVPLSRASSPESLERRFDALQATDGGTPLTDMILDGVRQLQKHSPRRGVVNTLVVLTDGGSNGSTKSLAELEGELRAAVKAGPPVRVLITAAGDDICQKLRKHLAEPGDGNCFRAPNQEALECVASKIVPLLRTPQPAAPRSARAKERAGQSCAAPSR